MNRLRRFLASLTVAVLTVMTLAPAPPAHAQQPKELHIAAAADLTPVMPRLAAEYEKETGVAIIPSFASSATLTDQIRNGGPFDVFLSADRAHPQQLSSALLTEEPPVPYARGVLVLWARNDSPAQPLRLDSLLKPAVTRIAVANPAHAPYGLAAQQALQSLHLYDKVASKLAIAENIAQTAQFAASGNAQAGLISLTTANTQHFRAIGSYIPVPAGSYAPLDQCGVVLKSSKNAAAAQAFLRWLTSPATQAQMPSFGLHPAH